MVTTAPLQSQVSRVFNDVAFIKKRAAAEEHRFQRDEWDSSSHAAGQRSFGKVLQEFIPKIRRLKDSIPALWSDPDNRSILIEISEDLVAIGNLLSDPIAHPPIPNGLYYRLLDKAILLVLKREPLGETGFGFPSKPRGMALYDYVMFCAFLVEGSEFAHAVFDLHDAEFVSDDDISEDFFNAVMNSPIYDQVSPE